MAKAELEKELLDLIENVIPRAKLAVTLLKNEIRQ